jgi:Leucine-rich repeat (LRR) protein
MRVQNLSKLHKLELLDLSHNDIARLEDISELTKNSMLNDLKIIFNPFAET